MHEMTDLIRQAAGRSVPTEPEESTGKEQAESPETAAAWFGRVLRAHRQPAPEPEDGGAA